MAGFPLAAIGAGIGQFFQNYEQQKRSQQQRALEQLQADQIRQNALRQQKQDQASGLLFNSLLGGESGQTSQAQPFTMPSLGGGQVGGGGYGDLAGLANLGGGMGGGGLAPSFQRGPVTNEQPGRTQSGGSLGGGLRAGGALTGNPFVDKLVSLGVKPEVASGAVEYMRRNESGLRPDAVNPSSGALGAAQWLGPRKRALQGQYGAAPSLSQQADFMGQELQGPEGRTLAALRGASSGRQGYDIWGRDYERPGGAALAKAGVGGASPIHQEAQQAALGAAQITPPEVYGRMSLRGLAQQIDKANPDADPVVKMMALEQAAKLLAPSDQRAWEMFKLQHDDQFKIAQIEREDRRFDITERRMADSERRMDRRDDLSERRLQLAEKSAEGRSLPEELQFPDKWEGMPEKGPPGTRQDVWAATLEYVRTNRMPALGFQPGMKNLIIQASPAAMHALGVKPSEVADLQAQYAGERHGQIVGGGRAANIEFGIQEAKKAAPQVVETSKAVPRTSFPPINQFTNWLSEKTGDPNIVAFRDALNTFLNVYASTVSRTGHLTDAQQRHAYDLLSTSFNQGQIDRGIEQLTYEMDLMRESVAPAMEGITNLGRPPATKQTEPPAPSPQQRQQAAPASLPTVRSQAEYDALAPGARYLGPDGKERQKPGPQEPPT